MHYVNIPSELVKKEINKVLIKTSPKKEIIYPINASQHGQNVTQILLHENTETLVSQSALVTLLSTGSGLTISLLKDVRKITHQIVFDGIIGGRLCGWIMSIGTPNKPLQLLASGKVILRIPCETPRYEISNILGMGTSHRGFRYDVCTKCLNQILSHQGDCTLALRYNHHTMEIGRLREIISQIHASESSPEEHMDDYLINSTNAPKNYKRNSKSSGLDVNFSIIIPCHNGEKFLRRAIESVMRQTYKNFEIIFIDDGSTDNSLKIISKYKRKIKIFRNKKMKNVSCVRNFGVKQSVGNILCFLDVDNFYEADYLEKLKNEYQKGQRQVVYTAQKIVYERCGHLKCFRFLEVNHLSFRDRNVLDLNCFSCTRAVFDQANGFCELSDVRSDWILFKELVKNHRFFGIRSIGGTYQIGQEGQTITERLG